MRKVIAAKLRTALDGQGLPKRSSWGKAPEVSFCSDWRAENRDPERETRVQLLWSPDDLFVRFQCRYREIFAYAGANSRRDRLWQWDVAEVFLQPESSEPRRYKEFEISPNGDWLDLDIAPGEKSILFCGLRSRVVVDPRAHIWIAELGIPFNSLTEDFDPHEPWRLNFFRIEGQEPNRFYSAWIPTCTPQPNFHVPERFGTLQLET
jgi:alpha-galactosidase